MKTRKKKRPKISLLSMTRKFFYRIILFMEECGDILLETDRRIIVYVFCLVFYSNLGNKILGEAI